MYPSELRGKLVYLASPYSSDDPGVTEYRMQQLCMIDAEMIAEGIFTVTPLSKHFILGHGDLPGDWDFWRDYCCVLLPRCDAVYVIDLPGWDSSLGVKGEIELAQTLGIPVYRRS